jgi:hypothetical protein
MGIAETIPYNVDQFSAPTGDSILLDAVVGYLKLENGDYILLDQ